MNKAFVKDPEPAEPRCPPPDGCGALGIPVTRTTLSAQLSELDLDRFTGKAYYCPSDDCSIAYFDPWGVTVRHDAVRTRAFPKDPGAPVCSCFGVTTDDIRIRASSGDKEWARDLLAKAEAAGAECETKAPSGKTCAVEFRKIFLRFFEPR